VLSAPRGAGAPDGTSAARGACSYSGYCGSYGCDTGAKGTSLEGFLPRALATGRCDLKDRAYVQRIVSDDTGRAVAVEYRDRDDRLQRVEARIFVVACQAIESARLLLLSTGPRHPRGLGNRNGLVGRHLMFSTFGAAWGDFPYHRFESRWPWLRSAEPFVNRYVQDWYEIDHPNGGRRKGGTLNFLLMHPNPIAAAEREAFHGDAPVWGEALQARLARYFRETAHLRFEVFGDYTPTPEGRVILDPDVKDRHGRPAARAQVIRHPRDKETVEWLIARGEAILQAMGAENVRRPPFVGNESANLVAGTCRFGDDPATSVLDRDCRAHFVDNLYVTDGSFMPSAGSVPFTFTIYANALRVAARIVERLGGVPR
jgi:choline dehydrogenase-like flavoprotein